MAEIFSIEECICRENHDKIVTFRDELEPESLVINFLKKILYTPNQIGRIMSLYKGGYDIMFNNLMTGVGDERLWLYHSRINSYMNDLNDDDFQVSSFSILTSKGLELMFSRDEMMDMVDNFFNIGIISVNHAVTVVHAFLNGYNSMNEYVPLELRYKDEYDCMINSLSQPNYDQYDDDEVVEYDVNDLFGIDRDFPVGHVHEWKDCREVVGSGLEPLVKEVLVAYPTVETKIVSYVEDLKSVSLVNKNFNVAAAQEAALRFKEAHCRLNLSVYVDGRTYIMRSGKQTEHDAFKRKFLKSCNDVVFIERGGYRKTQHVKRYSIYAEYGWYNITVSKTHPDRVVAVESVTELPLYKVRCAADFSVVNMGLMASIVLPDNGLFYSLGNFKVRNGPEREKKAYGQRVKMPQASYDFVQNYQESVWTLRLLNEPAKSAMRYVKILISTND